MARKKSGTDKYIEPKHDPFVPITFKIEADLRDALAKLLKAKGVRKVAWFRAVIKRELEENKS